MEMHIYVHMNTDIKRAYPLLCDEHKQPTFTVNTTHYTRASRNIFACERRECTEA